MATRSGTFIVLPTEHRGGRHRRSRSDYGLEETPEVTHSMETTISGHRSLSVATDRQQRPQSTINGHRPQTTISGHPEAAISGHRPLSKRLSLDTRPTASTSQRPGRVINNEIPHLRITDDIENELSREIWRLSVEWFFKDFFSENHGRYGKL